MYVGMALIGGPMDKIRHVASTSSHWPSLVNGSLTLTEWIPEAGMSIDGANGIYSL